MSGEYYPPQPGDRVEYIDIDSQVPYTGVISHIADDSILGKVYVIIPDDDLTVFDYVEAANILGTIP